jgi:hypothetical protein
VTWEVRAAGPATTIERVILVGHHRPRLATKTSAAVESRSFDERTLGGLQPCGYSFPYNGGGCDTDRLLAGIEGELRRPVTSFSGTYQGGGFVLRADGTADIATSGGFGRHHFARPAQAARACRPPLPSPRPAPGGTAPEIE